MLSFSSACLRSVISRPTPTIPILLPCLSSRGTLVARFHRVIVPPSVTRGSSRLIIGVPDWMIACSSVRNRCAISRGRKSKSDLPTSSVGLVIPMRRAIRFIANDKSALGVFGIDTIGHIIYQISQESALAFQRLLRPLALA